MAKAIKQVYTTSQRRAYEVVSGSAREARDIVESGGVLYVCGADTAIGEEAVLHDIEGWEIPYDGSANIAVGGAVKWDTSAGAMAQPTAPATGDITGSLRLVKAVTTASTSCIVEQRGIGTVAA